MKKLFDEFRAFVNRGNVIDLAVAVIIGGAFTAIINSLVGDLITPILSLITGGVDFSNLKVSFGDSADAATLNYGLLIQAILNFLLISIVVFIMVKAINKVVVRKVMKDIPVKTCPYCGKEIPKVAVRCPLCTTILDESKVPEDIR